jgi:hypothetical protein
MIRSVTEFVIVGPGGEAIDSVDRWFEVAPPRGGASQWVDGKSAKELAKAWFASGTAVMPKELAALLASFPLTRNAVATLGIAERGTTFDEFGRPRKHDLLLQLQGEEHVSVVAIEAKVNEVLGVKVLERLDAEDAKRSESNVRARVEALAKALFGRTLDEDVKLGTLRYQLLTAAAGILVEASQRKAGTALLVVHDLGSQSRAVNSLSETQMDVSDFVTALGGDALPINPGRVYGPLRVAGGGRVPSNIPLHVALIEARARRRDDL